MNASKRQTFNDASTDHNYGIWLLRIKKGLFTQYQSDDTFIMKHSCTTIPKDNIEST